MVSGALKIDEDWEGGMGEEEEDEGEEEEEEDGDSEGRETDFSNMLAVNITEQVLHQLIVEVPYRTE